MCACMDCLACTESVPSTCVQGDDRETEVVKGYDYPALPGPTGFAADMIAGVYTPRGHLPKSDGHIVESYEPMQRLAMYESRNDGASYAITPHGGRARSLGTFETYNEPSYAPAAPYRAEGRTPREPARAFLNALLTLTRQGDVEAIRRGMQTFRDEPEVQYRGQAALTLLNDTNGGHIPPPRFGNV